MSIDGGKGYFYYKIVLNIGRICRPLLNRLLHNPDLKKKNIKEPLQNIVEKGKNTCNIIFTFLQSDLDLHCLQITKINK